MALIACLGFIFPDMIRWLDGEIQGEPIKNFLGIHRWKEDWRSAEPVPAGLDTSWMHLSKKNEILIAHALGSAGTAQADTLQAMRAAWRAGFRIFEVDLWLDGDGRIRCYHGDMQMTEPPRYREGDCLFESVLAEMGQDSWLILDVKSDFEKTGREIIKRIDGRVISQHIIFQLYSPSHTALFNGWLKQVSLPGPIVTTYAAHRGTQHIAEEMARLNVHALTLPLAKLSTLAHRPADFVVLVHPVHDCQSLNIARAARVNGFYALASLNCL